VGRLGSTWVGSAQRGSARLRTSAPRRAPRHRREMAQPPGRPAVTIQRNSLKNGRADLVYPSVLALPHRPVGLALPLLPEGDDLAQAGDALGVAELGGGGRPTAGEVTQDALLVVVELLLVLLGDGLPLVEVGPPPPVRGRGPRQGRRNAPRPGLAYRPGGADPRKFGATACRTRPTDCRPGRTVCRTRPTDCRSGRTVCRTRPTDCRSGRTVCRTRPTNCRSGRTVCRTRTTDHAASRTACRTRTTDRAAGRTDCRTRTTDHAASRTACRTRATDRAAGRTDWGADTSLQRS
jgi:hypothetical protein